ncbi:23S rRNA (adenine(2503)-C(2))-methyltransferase [candidate division WOR-1 bacterium RIFCSPHIGHO2_01_FULL_53_15]|uniref:Probable dual-specificity RNA methyltransferase RlmN n=1 Tax=candidate division WOR-1 bacterium RIFCSPHIGHO2_01_FULL_53_15 TaxID=1802564 RepID=A0A1F4Q446_UNCSA|nr:MAG: 23S rRNA (adenine(2503)-C(2))-methyltransferase [candidate division WOR-1 bacterium RIFCSPHIGHO2_01_FULL_53_15]OGC13636.1 MAG: 23S rRNA (adenine(2503)-C(2))-methyltransferase [candidate division WOR-1 bacterium RIFCSPHIGHO2_02_FULL_53_26]
MPNIIEKSLKELQEEFKNLGLPAFRAKQVYKWIHHKLTFSFDEMTDLPKELRDRLKEQYSIETLRVKHKTKAKDGTVKYLFELADGKAIESVFIKTKDDRKTVCLSTQVGCPLDCLFCATGKLGFNRNLTAAEIISQAYLIANEHPDISNLVYMGMGEPFLNYDNVMRSVAIFTSDEGANFGQRRITISTCGLADKIKEFAEEKTQVRLAVSLNSADDALRGKLMPVNRKFPLTVLRQSLEYYSKTSNRMVTLEYVMLDGVNDREADLKKLINFCRGLDCKVNLIRFNRFGHDFRPSRVEAIDHFVKGLLGAQINAVVRRSRGEAIGAACGQLALRPVEGLAGKTSN